MVFANLSLQKPLFFLSLLYIAIKTTSAFRSHKKGYSERGLFGQINHYDAKGKKIGESRPGLFGGMTHHDAKGRKIGHSDPGLFGTMNHYDNKADILCLLVIKVIQFLFVN